MPFRLIPKGLPKGLQIIPATSNSSKSLETQSFMFRISQTVHERLDLKEYELVTPTHLQRRSELFVFH